MKLIYRYCGEMVAKYPRLFLKTVILSLLITLLNTLIPFGMRIFIEQVEQTEHLWIVGAGLPAFMVCMLLNTFIEIRWYMMLDEFGGQCITGLTTEIETAMARAARDQIDGIQSNVIKHIMYSDVLDVFRVIGHHIPSFIGTITTILVCLFLAVFYDLKLSLLIIAASAAGFMLSFASRKIIAQKAGQMQS